MFERLVQYIVDPLIILLTVVSVFTFLQGVMVYVAKGAEPEGRETGRRHMIWGIVGLFIIFGVYGFLNIVQGTLLGLFRP